MELHAKWEGKKYWLEIGLHRILEYTGSIYFFLKDTKPYYFMQKDLTSPVLKTLMTLNIVFRNWPILIQNVQLSQSWPIFEITIPF